jgi:hypothetical protein
MPRPIASSLAAFVLAFLASSPTAAAEPPRTDREAILAMAGEYEIAFRFHETVGVDPGYGLREPYASDAIELVVVAEDRGDFISLQHVLIGRRGVVKHWRQDWTYEDTRTLEFRGRDTWELVERSPGEVAGTWTQAVYQTDDGPRYEAVGRWEHLGDRSTWESEPTWRPLPRREYTTRDDYDVLVCRNRHTITPAGWFHEQDNAKVVLDERGEPARVVAHEIGTNSYIKSERPELDEARAYWERNASSWATVREAWNTLLSVPGTYKVVGRSDDQPRWRVVVECVESERPADEIKERLAAFVEG